MSAVLLTNLTLHLLGRNKDNTTMNTKNAIRESRQRLSKRPVLSSPAIGPAQQTIDDGRRSQESDGNAGDIMLADPHHGSNRSESIWGEQPMAKQALDTVELPTIEQLINDFKSADMKLIIAIENGLGTDAIGQAAALVERSIEELFLVECDSSRESKALYRFMVNRFVLNENASDSLRRRVCEKLLSRM